MTVRFRPVGNDEIDLLRMQVAEVSIVVTCLLDDMSTLNMYDLCLE